MTDAQLGLQIITAIHLGRLLEIGMFVGTVRDQHGNVIEITEPQPAAKWRPTSAEQIGAMARDLARRYPVPYSKGDGRV